MTSSKLDTSETDENDFSKENKELTKEKLIIVPPGVKLSDAKDVSEKDDLTNRRNQILEKYKYMESDIPLNSEYWTICNRLRSL